MTRFTWNAELLVAACLLVFWAANAWAWAWAFVWAIIGLYCDVCNCRDVTNTLGGIAVGLMPVSRLPVTIGVSGTAVETLRVFVLVFREPSPLVLVAVVGDLVIVV